MSLHDVLVPTSPCEPLAPAMVMESRAEAAVYQEMYDLLAELFPICRSITGDGTRQTLARIQQILPELEIHEVPSGTPCFDWEIPLEWNIRDAYILDEAGERVVDFRENNLHVVGYSVPVDRELSLEELEPHLYSLPEQPDAIPYVTSYYRPHWGFCLTHRARQALKPGRYRAVVDSTLEAGSLTYGELILRGREHTEVLLSTYVCHPSMANNELSGPVVVTYLARWLHALDRRHTYRIVFVPETIGAIAYLHRNLRRMKENTIAGFVATCVGDDRSYSYVASRFGNTLADRVARHVLGHTAPDHRAYSFLDRGSDERQYCSPLVDLPVVALSRSKFDDYPEYHTSLDNVDLVSPEGLGGAYEVFRRCIRVLERNERYRVTIMGEPQLGRRGLYPTTSTKDILAQVYDRLNLLAYCDGEHDLLQVADWIGVPFDECSALAETFVVHGVLERLEEVGPGRDGLRTGAGPAEARAGGGHR